jgi:hypothetical protein
MNDDSCEAVEYALEVVRLHDSGAEVDLDELHQAYRGLDGHIDARVRQLQQILMAKMLDPSTRER